MSIYIYLYVYNLHNPNHTLILKAALLVMLDQRAGHEAAQSTMLSFGTFCVIKKHLFELAVS